MPKVAYSEEERERIRESLVTTALELMARQGIQHTTVEQVYKAVGISRTFFYSFFPTKEDLIVETLYLQQPKILLYARSLMEDPGLSWREAVFQFLHSCCYGEKNGIAVLTIEEQQLIFRRLSKESYQTFREKQARLFGNILECFGIQADSSRISLFTNLSLTVMIIRRAIPQTLPLFVPEAVDETVAFQINAIVDCLESLRDKRPCSGSSKDL
jgi:AcrR family transcriptional regulator